MPQYGMDSTLTYDIARAQHAEPEVPRGGIRPHALAQVKRFIECRLHLRLSVADMAREACLSPFHFARMFKQSTGSTPHAYLNERRIETARALLAESALSIREVSRRAGFRTQAHFSSVFRRHAGDTPAAYRRQTRDRVSQPVPRHHYPALAQVQSDAR